ncbi:ornithine cyclodeaminase [Xenophilus sp.]|uniref:ornithine cyclodeaminase n=1 Tax=Xenophilus sp. TaxID=1873499 RepID=UPI0037DCA98D
MSTRFIDVPALAQLLQRVGLQPFIEGLAAAIEEDFRRWPDFDKTARLASHSPQGVIELMPVAGSARYAFKYVNGHPGNPARGLPTVMAFGALADVDTGMPVLLAELTLTTALRTAATSALAARALARPGARCMALIGCGAQAEFQALAFHALLGVAELRVHDRDGAAVDKLAHNLAPWRGLQVHRCADAAEAVRGADVVTTATADKRHAHVLLPAMVEPGMHLNAVGGDCPGKTELHPDVVRAARVFVEYAPQTRVEGEIQQMPAGFPVTELWQVLSGRAPGRTGAQEVTLFDSVGFALEDYAALGFVQALAAAHGVGREVELVPQAPDPKDLFGLALGTAAGLRRAA